MRVTAVCLRRLSSTSVAGLSPWPALIALEGPSQWDFFFPTLSFLVCSDVLLCPGRYGGREKKESVFPLFCCSEHRTIIFSLEPRVGVDLNNGFCVLICVGIYPAAWLV